MDLHKIINVVPKMELVIHYHLIKTHFAKIQDLLVMFHKVDVIVILLFLVIIVLIKIIINAIIHAFHGELAIIPKEHALIIV